MAESDKGVPQVGMIFKSREEAWLFWRAYGGRASYFGANGNIEFLATIN